MGVDPATDNSGRHDLTRAIAERTESLVVERLLQKKGVSVSLLGKMKALTESAEEFNKDTVAVLDGIADKISVAKVKRSAAADKHHGYYDGLIKGIEDSVGVIDRLSNGPLGEDGKG